MSPPTSPENPRGLAIPLGGTATDPDGVHYAVVAVHGDQVELRCWSDGARAGNWTVHATVGVPVRSGDRDVLVSHVLTDHGDRPWVVLGSADPR